MTSKIKVDNINKVSDDSNIIKKCGTTTTIGSGASNPIVVDGSAVTLGRCGGTVALASGATQTGLVERGQLIGKQDQLKQQLLQQLMVKVILQILQVEHLQYEFTSRFCWSNRICLQITQRTFQTNNLTVSPNGSEKIGSVSCRMLTLSTEGQSVTFVYVDGTEGWINTKDSTSNVRGNPFIGSNSYRWYNNNCT